ncbi:hypothetical protein EJB05_13191 [Eragrostis curvula]|uniref:Uncharacterized protein n=1 Tax=Eragrostis curvula TaxID=38414 RepID=A0A5J9VTF4_9POAL|nr:hypothetical protein EJB05_13191 [Eragrostis curvula]
MRVGEPSISQSSFFFASLLCPLASSPPLPLLPLKRLLSTRSGPPPSAPLPACRVTSLRLLHPSWLRGSRGWREGVKGRNLPPRIIEPSAGQPSLPQGCLPVDEEPHEIIKIFSANLSSVWFFVHLFLDSGFPGCAAMGASDEGDVQRRRLCDATADELPPPHCLSLSQHLRDASMVAFFVLRWVMVILRAGDTVVSAISKLLDFGGAEVVHYIIQLPSALKVIFILF